MTLIKNKRQFISEQKGLRFETLVYFYCVMNTFVKTILVPKPLTGVCDYLLLHVKMSLISMTTHSRPNLKTDLEMFD